MHAEQISVFLENKAGRLAEVGRILADASINIRALSLADTSDFGVLRLIVDQPETARQVLKDNGFTVRRTEVVAVEVEDRPGGLLKILDLMDNAGVNIEYMYAYANPQGGRAIMIFRFDPMDKAEGLLDKAGIGRMDPHDLYSR
ncbi:MAG: ACT domain-containing protein [Deltaproteobacteria bacterium]|nr:ACT domain-containing protein [Deltaproteobacteria bacterium]